MAEYDISQTSTTDLTSAVNDYSVTSQVPDGEESQKETYYDFPNSSKYLGYYKSIPELKKSIDALAIWTVGKGIETGNREKAILENIRGLGKDTILTVLFNMVTMKKALGDSFAEIIRNDKGTLINLKPLYTGDMRIVVDERGIIKRYEQRSRIKGQANRIIQPENILHLSNDRIANEIHGTAVTEVCQWVIDARNEAMNDYRVVIHRNRIPVRIIEVDTDNTSKRNALIAEYEDAIKKGEVLVIPKGTVEIKDVTINIQDPIAWIQSLENFFYQAVGIPRVIASSSNFSEASSKVDYLTFEPIYTYEQTTLEASLWDQLALRLKFNRPPSLTGLMSESEEKNTGQTGFQQNDVKATAGRTE